MGQTVDERASQPLVAEGRRPLAEGQGRGGARGTALIALADQLERQPAPVRDSGTKPSSSMISGLWPAKVLCGRFSSCASITSWSEQLERHCLER